MIYNVNDLLVEIDNQLFPAGNIQVWDCYPLTRWEEGHKTWYGLYFDVLFEDGGCASVDQEATRIANDLCSSLCDGTKDFDHFIVEIKSMQDGFKDVNHAYHCLGEEELAKTLADEIERHRSPQFSLVGDPHPAGG